MGYPKGKVQIEHHPIVLSHLQNLHKRTGLSYQELYRKYHFFGLHKRVIMVLIQQEKEKHGNKI